MISSLARNSRAESSHFLQSEKPQAPLMPFDGSAHTDIHLALPFTQQDYFDLVDKTGRLIREDKRGFIPAETPTVISQLGIDPNRWLDHIQHFGRRYANAVGSVDQLQAFEGLFHRQWTKGIHNSSGLYLN